MAPLGYDSKERKITVNEAEAETVRTIFRRYLEMGSLGPLLADLRRRGITTKRRVQSSGKIIGGIPFTRGPLAHLLRNRFYIGEVPFKGEILPGEQLPILDRGLFDAVQARLSEQLTNHVKARVHSAALLMGRIFDDRGNPMRTSHARKSGIKYRYYVSAALVDGRQNEAGSISRVPAGEIETLVARAIREHVGSAPAVDDRSIFAAHQPHIVIHPKEITIRIGDNGEADSSRPGGTIRVRWQKQSSKRRREVHLPASARSEDVRPIRSETRATLVAAIARGRRWLDELVQNQHASPEAIAQREGCSPRKVTMTISLAFLSPALVKAALEGRLPRGIGVTRLCDMPAEWSRQHRALGLNL
jgi:hypothetical protein